MRLESHFGAKATLERIISNPFSNGRCIVPISSDLMIFLLAVTVLLCFRCVLRRRSRNTKYLEVTRWFLLAEWMLFLPDRAHCRSYHPVQLTWRCWLCCERLDSSSISPVLLLVPPSHPLAFRWERYEILRRTDLSFRSESILCWISLLLLGGVDFSRPSWPDRLLPRWFALLSWLPWWRWKYVGFLQDFYCPNVSMLWRLIGVVIQGAWFW